jgi:hypothetical protein
MKAQGIKWIYCLPLYILFIWFSFFQIGISLIYFRQEITLSYLFNIILVLIISAFVKINPFMYRSIYYLSKLVPWSSLLLLCLFFLLLYLLERVIYYLDFPLKFVIVTNLLFLLFNRLLVCLINHNLRINLGPSLEYFMTPLRQK